MENNIQSLCTYCGVGCEIEAEIENGVIKKIKPVKSGVSSGGELCIKGKYGYEFLDKRIDKHLVSYEFIKKNAENMPFELQIRIANLIEYDDKFYEAPFTLAVDLAAWKIKDILKKYGSRSIAAIGGARTNIESAWLFQRFARKILKTPHVDNCARVCHSPSLSGLKMSIGEGASSVSFNEIYNAETIFVIGSNTTEAHPMVANRIIKAKRKGAKLIVVDVREIPLMKFADIKVILPFESNLLFLNALAREFIEKDYVDKKFIKNRCVKFEEYKENILKHKCHKNFFLNLAGFEDIKIQIEKIAKLLRNKTIFIWGLGVTEHLDGSESVNAISNLAMMGGHFGSCCGVLPLRGQNNVQGACDVGCLPYFLPDYVRPDEKNVGLMTPEIIENILKDKIKAILNMGEDILHIHPNQNKIHKAFEELEFLMVMEVMKNEITQKADIVFAVRSAYEKTGIYVNAERRLHLSRPLIKSDLPDDWEVIQAIENKIEGEFNFNSSEEVFDECKKEVSRFKGANYKLLEKNPLQWPIENGKDSPILHIKKFSTPDGKGHFHYHKYHLRGEVKDLLEGKKRWYLNTGRALAQYNNAAQTNKSERLNKRYGDDIVLINEIHKDLGEFVKLKSKYGESEVLKVKYTKSIRPYTIFSTFHFAKNKINFLFGDEADHKTETARFKSLEVEVINAN